MDIKYFNESDDEENNIHYLVSCVKYTLIPSATENVNRWIDEQVEIDIYQQNGS